MRIPIELGRRCRLAQRGLRSCWDEYHELMPDALHAQVKEALGLREFLGAKVTEPREAVECPKAPDGGHRWLDDRTDSFEDCAYCAALRLRSRPEAGARKVSPMATDREAKWAERAARRERYEAELATQREAHRQRHIAIVERALRSHDPSDEFLGPLENAKIAVDALLADGVVFARMGSWDDDDGTNFEEGVPWCPGSRWATRPRRRALCADCGREARAMFDATEPMSGLEPTDPIAPDALDHVTDAKQHAIGPEDDGTPSLGGPVG